MDHQKILGCSCPFVIPSFFLFALSANIEIYWKMINHWYVFIKSFIRHIFNFSYNGECKVAKQCFCVWSPGICIFIFFLFTGNLPISAIFCPWWTVLSAANSAVFPRIWHTGLFYSDIKYTCIFSCFWEFFPFCFSIFCKLTNKRNFWLIISVFGLSFKEFLTLLCYRYCTRV